MSGATTVVGYQGDESWATYPVISGRWLKGPGEAVVNTRFLQAAGIGVGDSITLTGGGHTTSVRIVGEVFNTHEEGMEVLTGLSTLTRAGFDVSVGEFQVDLRPGTGVGGYLKALNTALEPTGAEAFANDGGGNSTTIAMMDALIASLTLMLVTVAGLGVLNTVVLDTRERVHDLGVFKALGMAPRQTVAMVLTSVAGTGLVAGVIGVPAGVAVHRWIVPAMGHSIGTNMPPEVLAVYHLPVLVLLGLGGLVIAVAGALLPAGWAARTRTATALRTE
jgi:putative ABC transport system permease protein